MKKKKQCKVDWSRMAHHYVITVTPPWGERIVHSSTNRRYLERLIEERYSRPWETSV